MKVYFKNLNGLRFIAAFFVILQHTSDYKMFAVPTYSNIFHNNFSELGRYGVTLFFVLSGFLISYLLLTEQKTTNTVNIKKFYIRRVLRIWPLYFGVGILITCGFNFVFSRLGYTVQVPILTNLIYLFTFTINFQLLFSAYNRGIVEILWTVCVEEQFYAIWPWFIKLWSKHIKRLIILFILIGIISNVIIHTLSRIGIINGHINPIYIFTTCRFTHFGIGALAAYLLFNQNIYARLEKIISNKWIQISVITISLLICLRIIILPIFFEYYLMDVIPAILFAYIILAAISKNFIFNLENKLLKKLGIYSYGIYILHPTVGQLSIAFFKKYVPNNFFNYEFLYPITVTIIACIVAAISYELYEKRFLKLKQKFTIIKSNPV